MRLFGGRYMLHSGMSSARVDVWWSSNERNPAASYQHVKVGTSGETAQINWEEGGDDVRQYGPLCPGLHTYHNAQYRGGAKPRGGGKS